MPSLDRVAGWTEKATKISIFVAQVVAALLVVLALFDWKKTYNAVGLAHIGQVPSVIRCSKNDFDFGNIENNILNVKFAGSMCSASFDKKKVLSGSLTNSYICGGIVNFQIFIDPLQIILRVRDPHCGSHKSSVEVSYIVIDES